MAKNKLTEQDKELFKVLNRKRINHEEIQRILDEGADINARKSVGEYPKISPIHLAILKGDLNLLRFLHEKSADVNAKDEDNRTPLHYACGDLMMDKSRIKIEIVQFLLEHGAAIDACTYGGFTPLNKAVASRQTAIVEFLIQNGANIHAISRSGSLLFESCKDDDNSEIFMYLVNKGVDIHENRILIVNNNADQQKEEYEVSTWTLLHEVSRWGNLEIAEYMLKNGADKTAIYNHYYDGPVTPLQMAKSEKMKKLLS